MITRIGLLVVLAFAANDALAQKIYKCPDGKGGYEYTNIPCTGDAEPIKTRDMSFGESSRSAEMRVEGTACTGEYGYAKASGWIVNATKEARRVQLTATFTRGSAVVDSVTLPYTVAAFGRTPFDIQGGRYNADACRYAMTWE